MWLGFTTDEIYRMKNADVGWVQNHFPLAFDVPLTRAQCRQLIIGHGLPAPKKSACWMCPHRSNEEWRDIRDGAPEQWAEAVRLDLQIRTQDKRGGVYLHRALQPLGEVDIDSPDTQGEIFECSVGGCWT